MGYKLTYTICNRTFGVYLVGVIFEEGRGKLVFELFDLKGKVEENLVGPQMFSPLAPQNQIPQFGKIMGEGRRVDGKFLIYPLLTPTYCYIVQIVFCLIKRYVLL